MDGEIEVRVDADTTFLPLWGPELPGHVELVRQTEAGDILAEVSISGATWERVVATGTFCLLPEVCDEGGPEALEAGRPVKLTLRLRDGAKAPLGDRDLVFRVAQALVSRERHKPVTHRAEAWLLCTATQRVTVPEAPELWAEIGMKTAWAR